MTIRAATLADVAAITEIYNHYITDSIITFEEDVVSESEMAGRIQELQKCGFPWNVFDRWIDVGYWQLQLNPRQADE